MNSPRTSLMMFTPSSFSLHQRRYKSLSELDVQSLNSAHNKTTGKHSVAETRASSQLPLFPESCLHSPKSLLISPKSTLVSSPSIFPVSKSGRNSPKSHMGSTNNRLADRLGTREWVKSASGGKLKDLLFENGMANSQKRQRKWDTFLGYQGAPHPRGVTTIDLVERAPRLTMSRADEYGAHSKPLCWKEMPKHTKEATVAQALLYLKLRDSRFSKDEAVKHSSGFRFKTDTGLHHLKGTENPFLFNGVQVRVPVSDPENKFKPFQAVENHKDFEMLSKAYEKFTRKYQVVDGEFEEKKDSFSRVRLKDFKEAPRPYWMERREITPKHRPLREVSPVPASVPPPEDISISEEKDTVAVSSHSSPEPSEETVRELKGSYSPRESVQEAAKESVVDAIAKAEVFSGGNLVFRSLKPQKQPHVPLFKNPRLFKGRKSTDAGVGETQKVNRINRRASSFIPLRTMFK